ncbi:MAG: hypothetical protein IKN04_01165 [Clostridia bacterium]|nr:hypothetical protein [Clostridia bacterium]
MAKDTAGNKVYDPWQDMRQVFIPKRSRTEQNTLEVGVNDKTFFVPKDQFVDVPMPLWEVVHEMLDAQKTMEEEAKKASGQREFSMAV